MKKFDKERLLLALAGPVIALVAAIALTSIVLLASGRNPFEPYSLMLEQASFSDVQVLIVNQASMYYIAALAVALGFRMNLFNIGVDGQYRLAAMMAAAVGANVCAPGLPPDPAPPPGRHAHRRLLGRYRGHPEGHPGGQRGRRDDHAQRDRHQPHRLADALRQLAAYRSATTTRPV